MANIIYSVCGEGRGHATRAISVIERYENNNSFLVLSFGEGYKFLLSFKMQSKKSFKLLKINGINYKYKKSRIWSLGTYLGFIKFILFEMHKEVKKIEDIFIAFKPELAIVDFEPCLPRVAKRNNIPIISVDHQHFIRFYDSGLFPPLLRIRAKIGELVCKLYVPGADEYIISAFFHGKLRMHKRHVIHQSGPFINNKIMSTKVTKYRKLLCYFRFQIPRRIIELLRQSGYQVVIYGQAKSTSDKNIKYKLICRENFTNDLASCCAVICSPGNQLIGEALFLGKPVLALPERNNYEQVMNSYHLRNESLGDFAYIDVFDESHLKRLLSSRTNPMKIRPAELENPLETLDKIFRKWFNEPLDKGGLTGGSEQNERF